MEKQLLVHRVVTKNNEVTYARNLIECFAYRRTELNKIYPLLMRKLVK